MHVVILQPDQSKQGRPNVGMVRPYLSHDAGTIVLRDQMQQVPLAHVVAPPLQILILSELGLIA